MATKKLVFPIALDQNKNSESTAYGKWFGKTYNENEALNLKGLVQRVAMDQSVITPEIAAGVIDRLTTTMVELLQSGQSIKWDSLGTFRPTVESSGVENPEDYNVNTDVLGIHIRFIPENSKGEEITSRMFADMCTMQTVGLWKTRKVTVSGKTKYVREFKPSATVSAQGGSSTPAVGPIVTDVYYSGRDSSGKAYQEYIPFVDGKYVIPTSLKGKSIAMYIAGLNQAGDYTVKIGDNTLTEIECSAKGATMPSIKYYAPLTANMLGAAGDKVVSVVPPGGGDAVTLATVTVPE